MFNDRLFGSEGFWSRDISFVNFTAIKDYNTFHFTKTSDSCVQSTMNHRKIHIVLFLLVTAWWLVVCDNPGFQIYVKNIHCNVSEKYIHKNLTCFAKSYSRNVSTITVSAFSKQPINSVFVS